MNFRAAFFLSRRDMQSISAPVLSGWFFDLITELNKVNHAVAVLKRAESEAGLLFAIGERDRLVEAIESICGALSAL